MTDRAHQAEADPHVLVFADRHPFVEAADRRQRRAPGQYAGCGDAGVREQRAPAVVADGRRRTAVDVAGVAAVLIEQGGAAGDEAHGGVAPDDRELARELARQPFVVGVEEGDIFAARRGDAGVARRRRAARLLRPIRQLRTPRWA